MTVKIEDQGVDQEQATEPVVEPVQPVADIPAEKTFTQSEVNAMIAKAKTKAKKSALKTPTASQPNQTEAPNHSDDISSLRESISELSNLVVPFIKGTTFDKRVAGLQLDKGQADIAQTLFNAGNDTALGSFLDGVKATVTPSVEKPGFGGLNVPSPTPSNELSEDPRDWDPADAKQMAKDGTLLAKLRGQKKSGFGF